MSAERPYHRFRPILWFSLLILTFAIFLFPVHLQFKHRPLESIYIFNDLGLFATLYSAWSFLLLLSLFSKREERGHWERCGTICIFSLVFLGFWVAITHGNLFGEYSIAQVKYLGEEGKIPFDNLNLYQLSEFPGLDFLGLSLYKISGLGIFETRTLFLLSNIVFLPIILYVLYSRSLKSSCLAAIAVLLLLHGNSQISRSQFFWGGNLGLTLFSVLLMLSSWNEHRKQKLSLIHI